ncbi:dihydroorotase [Corynebacterium mastitidis]|uniref:dihydroorotase n=1 Tax=Corynebacterium mastitidis TaxID=161890 RepID=UPI00254BDD82|nr:dihydroorotase [Corynebacterium mastitidis]MDK8451165.1 dihydroorotase [Corynebacterium mastitidis]
MATDYPQTGPLNAPEPDSLLIREVRPYGEGELMNVLVRDGVIASLDAGDATAERVVEGRGGVLLPGLVDMHVHFREPGREDAEAIATGSRAAARGGFTAVFTMANTTPVIDQPVLADAVWAKGQEAGLCDVHPVGAITKNREGKQLAELGMMADSQARVRVFSDDGTCVDNSALMRRAVEYSKAHDVLLAQHCEDPVLTEAAVAHEGPTAARLGLRGWPRAAEESIVARDLLLSRDYGGRVHICHASTAGTVALLKWAKEQGIEVSAEVTPHHLLLTDARLETYDAVNKVNPPLREDSDVAALRQALLDGVLDCVATDHAPHAAVNKCCEFDHALPGMLGLETSLAIIAEIFVRAGLADWRWVAKVMSERPAQITKLPGHGRPLAVGEPANLAVVAEDRPWTVKPRELASKAENTPFAGMEFHTKVAATVLRGKVTHEG